MGPDQNASLVQRQPVAVIAAVAVVVVSVAAKLKVGLETDVVETLIANAVIVVSAALGRRKVTPVASPRLP
jgi:hypothetical protein